MFTRLRTLVPAIVIVFLFSQCKKDLADTAATNQLSSGAKTSSLALGDPADPGEEPDEPYGWFGYYRYPDPQADPDWPGVRFTDYNYIKNGIASLKNEINLPTITSSSFVYNLFPQNWQSGDSIVFEARIRTTNNAADLQINDYLSGAFLRIDTPANGKRSYYIRVGNTSKTVSVAPVLNFKAFRLVQFAIKGTNAFVYVDNDLITKMSLPSTSKIGSVNRLQMTSTTGIVELDKVRLLNSYTKKVKMREDFNTDGQPNTVFP